MSVADATARKLDVVGPSGILHLLASMRLYTFRSAEFFKTISSLNLNLPNVTGIASA